MPSSRPEDARPEHPRPRDAVAGAQRDRLSHRTSTRRFLDEVNYPHSIHPALVPGVSVEDQKVHFGLDKIVFGVTAVLAIAFVVWGMVSTASLADGLSTAASALPPAIRPAPNTARRVCCSNCWMRRPTPA